MIFFVIAVLIGILLINVSAENNFNMINSVEEFESIGEAKDHVVFTSFLAKRLYLAY
jgi:hypothetical protein